MSCAVLHNSISEAQHTTAPQDVGMASSPLKASASVLRTAASRARAPDELDLEAWAGEAVTKDALPILKEQYQKAQQNNNGWSLRGKPMSRDEVRTHYPKRKGIFSPGQQPWGKHAFTSKDEEVVVFNFRRMHCYDEDAGENFWVELGDNILTEDSGTSTTAGTPIKQLMRVVEIFTTLSGGRYIRGQWYYQQIDTAMACREKKTGQLFMPVPNGTIDERRLWLATVEDSETYDHIFALACIDKKVLVVHVPPGKAVGEVHRDYDPNTDYWFDQVHTRRCITNEDCFEDWSPFSALYKELEEKQGLEAIRELLKHSPTGMIRGRNGGAAHKGDAKRVIVSLDIFAGAGGLSFLAEASDEHIHFDTAYACDWNESACATFEVNHPKAHVFHLGLDQFVMLLKMWYKFEEAVAAAQADGMSEEEEEEGQDALEEVMEIVDVRLCEDAPKHIKGSSKGQLKGALQEDECRLEFLVRRQGRPVNAWEKVTAALTAAAPMQAFVERTNAAKRIPHPGDIQLIAGGPPCQGVSGLNRHAIQENVLKDPRNRLVHTYLELVDLLQPNYILMEQVADIFKKEGGMYARYTVCQLVRHGYQTRVGQCTAGNYGCAQGRRRVFFWGARSGLEQLPAFPRPTHRCKDFNTGVCENSQECHVDFEDAAQRAAAHPMVVMGDQLSDLPRVHNFCMSERQQYATEPTTLIQKWLRRPPPAGSATLEQRSQAADERMNASAQQHIQLIDMLNEQGGKALVGRSVFCRKKDTSNKNFAGETWAALLGKELGSAADGEAALPGAGGGARDGGSGSFLALQREVERRNIAVALGDVVLREKAAALAADGPLRDHRPLMCNADDYLRMVNVPREKAANYRDMAGVVTNADGTACGGHWHATRKYSNATGTNHCGCGGGGMEPRPKASNNKASRVDSYGATEAGAWRGTLMDKCDSRTTWLPTGDLLAPRWTITYKNGKSNGRHGCYGRIWYDEIQSTVVTRAEPHNLQILHPEQDRVLTVRENARCQGFPDYHVLVGVDGANKNSHGCGGVSVEQRYLQMGNAVAPPVALMLGHCLRLAAQGQSPVAEHVITIRDPAYEACMEQGRKDGLFAYCEKYPVAESDRGYCWKRHRSDMANKLAAEIVQDDEEEPAPIDDDDGDDEGGASDDDGAGSGGAGAPGSNKRAGSTAGAKPPPAKRAKASSSGKQASAVPGGQAGEARRRAGSAKAAARPSKAAALPPRAPPSQSARPSRRAAEVASAAIWRSALSETQLAALDASAEGADGAGVTVAVAGAVAAGAVAGAVGAIVRAKAAVMGVAMEEDAVAMEMDQDGALGAQPEASASLAVSGDGAGEVAQGQEEQDDSEDEGGADGSESLGASEAADDGDDGEGHEDGSDGPMLELDALASGDADEDEEEDE